jgi:hypothetical protein
MKFCFMQNSLQFLGAHARLLPNTPTFRGDHEHTTINAVTTLVLEMIVFLASSFIRRTLSTPYLAKLCVFRD